MTKFGLAAILALTSSTAFAGSVFEIPINGGTARIRIDGSCRDSLCASVSYRERGSRGEPTEYKLPEISAKTISKLLDGKLPGLKSTEPDDDDDDAVTPPAREREPVAPRVERDPAPAPAPALAAPPAAAARPVAAPVVPAPAPVVSAPVPLTGPSAVPTGEPSLAGGPPAPSATSGPTIVAPARIAVAPTEPKVAAVAPAPAPTPAPAPAPAATSSRSSPVGEWRVEDGEGQIRIEECGANLCGYVATAKNPNEKDRKNPDPSLRSRSVIGMPVLINMKPSGNRWKGRIYNVKDGGTYDANISLKSADVLRVEGCAFGGLVCGGQSWTRVN